MRRVLVGLLAGLALAPSAASADDGVLFRLTDARITEASGLVDRGRTMVTMNDSGHGAVLYVVNRRGRTVGTTTYAPEVTDVEALAPAGPDRIWAADIGDNEHARHGVAVYRVPVGLGARRLRAPRYPLAYPDGAHDAEALVADGHGRLYVVTKGFTSGAVYATTGRLRPHRLNRLHRVARVGPLVTDAALMRDRRHVLLRDYADATVYTFPGFRRVASFPLPSQPQGEGISVGPHGRIRVGSEGVHSAVLAVPLPADVRAAMIGRPSATPTPSPSLSPSASPSPTSSARPAGRRVDREAPSRRRSVWLMLGVPAILAVGGIGIGLAMRRRNP